MSKYKGVLKNCSLHLEYFPISERTAEKSRQSFFPPSCINVVKSLDRGKVICMTCERLMVSLCYIISLESLFPRITWRCKLLPGYYQTGVIYILIPINTVLYECRFSFTNHIEKHHFQLYGKEFDNQWSYNVKMQ